MKASSLASFLEIMIKNHFPVLIIGEPGTGKSDIIGQAAEKLKQDFIVMHPAISDPSKFEGLPFPVKDKNGFSNKAEFLPYGDLYRLVVATKPTIALIDDIGQAPMAVQAACMQLLLARRVNEKKVSNHVTFIAASNRRQDHAGVQGLLEPVKSRFVSIIHLDVDLEDWARWAVINKMPTELISFIRFRPNLLLDFKPTKDLVNTSNPRTVANCGKLLNAKVPQDIEYEALAGAAGEGFAAEFLAFLRIYRQLPDIDLILSKPNTYDPPTEPSVLYAITGAVAAKANRNNIDRVINLAKRLPIEFQIVLLKDAVRRDETLVETTAFQSWASANANTLVG